jgi:lipopolysaccharide/colanic/teichoic acid biosynthesis glycosyltransferase
LKRIFPVLIDDQPEYLAGQPATSLLRMPLGRSTVHERLRREIVRYTRSRIVVVTRFKAESGYATDLAALGVRPEDVLTAAGFRQRLAQLEPSDWLLIRDCRRISLEVLDLGCILDDSQVSPRSARHIVCLAGTEGGTDERVLMDAAGHVSRIQRYYESVTWPFASGVACSLVPVAAALGLSKLPITRLAELRATLAAASVPSRDFFLETPCFDLETEAGFLDITEALLSTHPGDQQHHGPAGIDPTAVVRGAVVIERDVAVESDALIIGPSVLGRGSRVGRGAIVAQCVVAPGAAVPPGSVVRHSVVVAGRERDESPVARSESASGAERPAARELAPERQRLDSLKRPVDALLSLVGLVVLFPLLALVALLIKLDSSGPLLFGDRREGRGGRVFRCWKFRTMVMDADVAQRELASTSQVDGPQFKIDDDPRITRLGRWLRRLNVDELPQLLNVLKGEMSLVGPRPSPFRENQVCIPWREARLSVRPGITGLWQICRHERSSGDFHQWIYYDLLYVDHMSSLLDLKILVATTLSLGGRFPVPLSRILSPAKFHERRRLPRPDGPDLTHRRLLGLSADERREGDDEGGDRGDLQIEVDGDLHQHLGEGGEQPRIVARGGEHGEAAPEPDRQPRNAGLDEELHVVVRLGVPAEVWPSPRGAVSDAAPPTEASAAASGQGVAPTARVQAGTRDRASAKGGQPVDRGRGCSPTFPTLPVPAATAVPPRRRS